jgi:hypothetical protein
MKLEKVHRVVRFKQSNFLKQYISLCTAKRAASSTPFEKRQYKLFVNAVFGKFIERVRNYLDCKICYTRETAQKWISSPRYTAMKIISKNLTIIFLRPKKLTFNKAYAIGFSILELSKYFMFQQYYEHIQPKLKTCEVLFTDTDSLAIAIFSKNKTDGVKKMRKIIDFSNYPKNHQLYSSKRANTLGLWKDELQGEQLHEYVGLRSKCYALKIMRLHERDTYMRSTCKGVRKGYRKKIPFHTYKKCVDEIYSHNITQYNIQSKAHTVRTMRLEKIGFSSFDDKRYLMKCGLHSLAYGSCYIKKCEKYNTCLLCPSKK